MSRRCNKILVYSALHTGTHFTCFGLRDTTVSAAEIKADQYTYDNFSKKIEDFDVPLEGVNRDWIDYIVPANSPKLIILSGHQKDDSNLSQSLIQTKPSIPVIIPMRDPLLSFNSKIWRETGSIRKLHEYTDRERIAITESHIDSIIRLLQIPKGHAYFAPVDLQKTNIQRMQMFSDMIKYIGEIPNKTMREHIKAWKHLNQTVDGGFHIEVSLNRYLDIKNTVSNQDIRLAEEYLSVELPLIRKKLQPYKARLEQLGYKDLCWW